MVVWDHRRLGLSLALSFPRLKSAPVHDDQIEVVHTGASSHVDSALSQQQRAPVLLAAD